MFAQLSVETSFLIPKFTLLFHSTTLLAYANPTDMLLFIVRL